MLPKCRNGFVGSEWFRSSQWSRNSQCCRYGSEISQWLRILVVRGGLGQNAMSYHVNGIFCNSGENSNGMVNLGGMFLGKKVISFEVFPFSRFDRNARKFLYYLSTITSARENRPFHFFFNWNNRISCNSHFFLSTEYAVPFVETFSPKTSFKW